jgi:hypothetical protein
MRRTGRYQPEHRLPNPCHGKRNNVYIKNQNKTNKKGKRRHILVEHEQYVQIGCEYSENTGEMMYKFEDYTIHQAKMMRKEKRSVMQLEYMSKKSYFSNIDDHILANSICGNNDPYSPYNDNNMRGKCVWDSVKYQYEFDLLVIATMSNNSYIAIEALHIFSKLWIRCMQNRHVSKSLSRLPNVLVGIIEGYL